LTLSVARLRIGTRGSPLALAQARDVMGKLNAAHALAAGTCEIVVIKTTGDKITDRPLLEAGGKGLFTKELEEALIAGDIDLAVHSMKDVPASVPNGLAICAVLTREDPRDAFISVNYGSLADLPRAATVGTSSPRRQAQVLRLRPDLNVVEFRGNVETRLRKLEARVADATFLACAGLNRLTLSQHITQRMHIDDMLPAVAQGAVGVEIRAEDLRTEALVAPLNDKPTSVCVAAERAFLARLEGSCRTPIAGYADLHDGALHIRGEILTPDGRERHAATYAGTAQAAISLGAAAAAALQERAGPHFFRGLA
jgi:hydroxymethylbilane synthase